MTFDAGKPRITSRAGAVARPTSAEPASEAARSPLGFGAASGLKLSSQARGFNPSRGGSALSGVAAAMTGQALGPEARLAAVGVVLSREASENPSAELLHHIHGGVPFVFASGNQQDRVVKAACKVASEGLIGPNGDPTKVRVLTWSSASGWLEVYPQDNSPMAYEANGRPIPYGQLKPETPRATYNNEALKALLYKGDARSVPDWLSPMEALQCVADTEIGTAEKPVRALYVMNGVGPYLREDLDSAVGHGRHYQQLVDMRPRMATEGTRKHIVFNDGPGLMPTKAAELGSRYEMPLPTRRMLETSLFAAITNHLFTKADPDAAKEPSAVTPEEIAAWREVVGASVSTPAIQNAIADGISLEAVKEFLPAGKSFGDIGRQLVGFTLNQAQDLLGRAVSKAALSDAGRLDFDAISAARFDMLKADYQIEMRLPNPDLPQAVGLENATGLLDSLKTVFAKGGTRKKAVHPSKLILLAGIPGMGKSLLAEQAAQKLGQPLYKVDLSLLFNKFVGQSEENFKRMFELLESLAPCVVWLDEIEKALGGTQEGAATVDGGVTARTHGLLLQWLNDHKSDVLIIGTCNEPEKMSSAMLNRIDEKFFVGYLGVEGIKGLWRANLDAKCDAHDLTDDQLRELAELKPSITGREVAQRVNAARRFALARDGEEVVTFEDVKKALQGFKTAFEQSPDRFRRIAAMSADYQAAGSELVLEPAIQTGPSARPAAEPVGGVSPSAPAARRRGDALDTV